MNAARIAFVLLPCLAGSVSCQEQPKLDSIKFTRWVSKGETEGRFETAVVRYEDSKGRYVDLHGAVHIGDSSYYQLLQKEFEGYDAVLYELVAPKGTRPQARAQKSTGMISRLQRAMKSALDLDFQLDAIDYTKSNFVHADLDPTRFFEKQKEKGESIVSLMLRAMMVGAQREKQGKGPKVTPLHILAALFSADRGRYLKFVFAQELDNMEAMLAAFGGDKASRSVIVGERNAECMRVLDEQLAAGKKRLSVFYGAAHMPDMEQRLAKRGFRRGKVRWVTAWDCMMTEEMRAAVKARKEKRARRRKAKAAGK